MTTLPSLAEFLRSERVKLDDANTLFEEDEEDEAPTPQEIAKLYTRALDARKRVKLTVPKGQQATTFQRMKHFETYGKASCRYLSQQICKTLPRELRDMIYDSILANETINVPASPTCDPIYAPHRAHYWRHEYVGREGLAELLEVWYRSVRFHIGMDIGFLERFLSANVSYLNVPRFRSISKISIKLDQRDSLAKMTQSEDDTRAFSPRKRLIERLGFLFQLKRGASIHIYAKRPSSWTYMPEKSFSTREFQNLLRDITTPIISTLRRLKQSGYSVEIAVEDNAPFQWPQIHQLYTLEGNRDVSLNDIYFRPEGEVDLVWRKRNPPGPIRNKEAGLAESW